MRLALTETIIDKLVRLPETGMGYQLVDLVLRDGRLLRGVRVFNGESAELPAEFGPVEAADIVDVWLTAGAARH